MKKKKNVKTLALKRNILFYITVILNIINKEQLKKQRIYQMKYRDSFDATCNIHKGSYKPYDNNYVIIYSYALVKEKF